MRKLTDRINDLTESPTKSPKKQVESQKTGVSQSHMGETDQQAPTVIEAGSRTGRDSVDLKPYNDSDQNEELRSKQQGMEPKPVREVVVQRGGGGETAPNIEVP